MNQNDAFVYELLPSCIDHAPHVEDGHDKKQTLAKAQRDHYWTPPSTLGGDVQKSKEGQEPNCDESVYELDAAHCPGQVGIHVLLLTMEWVGLDAFGSS